MIQLMQGDCLELMASLEDKSIDMILTDPPYGTTACKWDSVVNLEAMWSQLKRVIKPNGAVVMTASQPFTTTLISSNMKMFKYCWVWEKNSASGHLNSKKRPMVAHEDICVFSRELIKYNPQFSIGHSPASNVNKLEGFENNVYNTYSRVGYSGGNTHRYPRTVFKIGKVKNDGSGEKRFHPTQKPVALMEYLIKTYTNLCETVLDFTMGSGTTGVACQNLHRNFIGIELDPEYFNIAQKRLADNASFSKH